MAKYSALKTGSEFTDLLQEMYFPPLDKIEEIDLPAVQVISVTGKGAPESKNFQQAIASLYGIAYGLKMGFKFGKLAKPKGYFDFKVPPLEGLWWQDGGFDMKARAGWEWKVMILMPAFINGAAITAARQQALSKHPEIPYDDVKLENFNEGHAVQLTHMGPYAEEPKTIAKLMEYIKDKGFAVSGKHHEIYMNDPRRVKPEKIKTVLRYPVK